MMRRFVVAACLCVSSGAMAATLAVPGDHPSIQDAIDAASPGDVVHVAPGRYVESIDLKGKPIHVLATDGPRVTFLDGTTLKSSLIRCVSGEGPDTIIEGFRVTKGSGDSTFYGPEATVGGGMVIMSSSPTVRKCVFEKNDASYNGGGIFCGSKSSVLMDSCRFVKNSAEKGGAIFNIDSSPQIKNCEFESNAARYAGGGIYNANKSNTVITECNFTLNLATYNGGAIYNYDSTPRISSCIFFNNAATYKGGAIYHGYRSGTLIQDGTSRFQTDNDDIAGGGYLMGVANPKGACCLGDACIEVEETPCVEAGGSWAGANTTCKEVAASICPKPRAGDMNKDGVVDINDMAILMKIWGTRRSGTPGS
jgi:predicted outer membrane repeat protein